MSDTVAAPTTSAPAASSTPSPSASTTSSAPSASASGSLPVPASSATPDPTPAVTTPTEPKRFQLKGKVDGTEKVWDLDEAGIVARLQKAEASEARMREAAEIRKAEEARRERIKKDPFAVLKEDYGVENFEELAEARLAEKYRKELMSDQERQQYELQEKLKAFEARENEAKEKEVQARRAAQEEKIFKQTEQTFTEALAKTGLPGDMKMLAMMAEIGQVNLKYGLDLTPEQMAAEVKDRLKGSMAPLKALKGDTLLQHLGEDVVEEVRQTLLARARGKVGQPATAQPPAAPPAQKPEVDEDGFPRKMNSMREWRKFLKE